MTVTIPRPILTALMKADLSGHQRKTLDYVILKTFGESIPTASITLADAAKEIDLSAVETSRMLKTLVDRRILKAAIPPRGTRRGIYRVNPNVSTWLIEQEEVLEMLPAIEVRRAPGKTLKQSVVDLETYRDAREEFISNWWNGFYRYTRQDYPFSAKDMGLISQLFKRYRLSLERVQALLVRFYGLWEDDVWMREHGALTITHFHAKIQNLIAAEAVDEIQKAEVDARLAQWAEIRAEAKRGK